MRHDPFVASPVTDSYEACRQIVVQSRSSFAWAFSLLRPERRHAMMALYAFARLVDDWGDDFEHQLPGGEISAEDWHRFVDECDSGHSSSLPSLARPTSRHDRQEREVTEEFLPPPSSLVKQRGRIALALADAMHRFQIPCQHLHEIIEGVEQDRLGTIEIRNREELDRYCDRVASSVGLACLSIWGAYRREHFAQAIDCGQAFQRTNILRDLREDAVRGRIYVPLSLLVSHGVDPNAWRRGNPDGQWLLVVEEMIAETRGLYRSGWTLIDALDGDGQRMFSLIWHHYHRLLERIEDRKAQLWSERVRLPASEKILLYLQHAITPLFRRRLMGTCRDA